MAEEFEEENLNQSITIQDEESFTDTGKIITLPSINKNTSSESFNTEHIEYDSTEIKLEPIKHIETKPMYHIHKPIIKMEKQDINPKKYDILTTVKNKSQINHERVCVKLI